LAFKKTITDQSKQLIDSCHWASAVDYAILAWSYVKATPVWDNHPHNNLRKHCFKILAASVMHALKKGNWSADSAIDVKNKYGQKQSKLGKVINLVSFLAGYSIWRRTRMTLFLAKSSLSCLLIMKLFLGNDSPFSPV
jgi:hypothetical protein